MDEINYTPIEIEFTEPGAKAKLLEYVKENKALVITISGFTILTVLVSGVLILSRMRENKIASQMSVVESQTKKTVSAAEVKAASDAKISPTVTKPSPSPTSRLTRPPTRTPTISPTASPTSPPDVTDTATPAPTNTNTPTNTPVPPSSTPVPPTPTDTMAPTDTPVPTATPTTTPTLTPTTTT